MSGEARTNERGPALGQNNRGKRERELKAPLELRMTSRMKKLMKRLQWTIVLLAVAMAATLVQRAVAQDDQDQDDPPSRVARLGYMQGSISFQPAGESEWVQAAWNRPLTTGDQIWSDRDSRAELSIGSAVIDLNSNTGITFLNLDDHTAQIQLSSGTISVRVRHMDSDDVYEIDTPNQALSIFEPGRYRVQASDDGTYTVVSIGEGEGESTGNGQTFTLHRGQRWTFEGTDRLNAQVDELGDPDDFDRWSYDRDRRYEHSESARYVSHDVVGYEDLDDNGDWRPDPGYGNVWYPRVAEGWAPYREGHWAWIAPWGWTWVDDEPWGYAPFHYGRWVSIRGRWGWVPGPPEVRPVYAPALVVFVGGGGGFGGNMGWFPLGPREVYVPSYRVSPGYVNRVNVSNTTVNVTQVTNVYNTTIINKTTVINNVTYVNKGVSGAVTAVPQQAFSSGQPVARAAVAVNAREIAAAPVNARAVVAPTSNSVMGIRANTAIRVAAPPAAVAHRAVVAKAAVPPPPVPFAVQQQALAAHPGQPVARQEMQRLRPANVPVAQPLVRQAPPGKPQTPPPTMARPANQPVNTPVNQPMSRPSTPPAAYERPAATPAQPARPVPNNQPAPTYRPATPPVQTDRMPAVQPNNRPAPVQPPPTQSQPNYRPPVTQPNNRPEPVQPQPTYRPAPEPSRPQPAQPVPQNRPASPPPSAPPQHTPPPAQVRPAPPQQHPLTPEEKKKQEEKHN
jgi:Family of unknown function (DUF6600)/FecR protein